MMFSGTPEELAEQVRKARALLEQIAECLNKLEEIAPGSVFASHGEIGGLGASVWHAHKDGWTVTDGR